MMRMLRRALSGSVAASFAAAIAISFAVALVSVGVASAQTLKLLSVAGFSETTNAHGKTISQNSRAKPQPGWQFINYDTDYLGTQANHGSTAVGYDTLYCVIVKGPIADCNGTVEYQGSVVTSILARFNLSKPTPPRFKVTYGTGVFAGSKWLYAANVKGFPQDEEFTISYQPVAP